VWHASAINSFVIPTLSEVEGEESAVLSLGTSQAFHKWLTRRHKKKGRPERDALELQKFELTG
jgi:hypothetical protein